jgi:hypothetical protein
MALMQPLPPLCGDTAIFDVCVSFNVSNTGSRDGADVPQLYVTYPAVANEPPRQLRFFTKVQQLLSHNRSSCECSFGLTRYPSQVFLGVGESAEVTMPLRMLPDLAIWNIEVFATYQPVYNTV